MGEGGRIVTIGSGIDTRASFTGLADYAASKAAIVGYSKGASRDLGPRGITANVVAPGPIDTDMLAALPDDKRDSMSAQVPVGRIGSVDEVAAAVMFLASEPAGYITGAVVPVDGGLGMGF